MAREGAAEWRAVHFVVGARREIAAFPPDATPEDVKEVFRAAAEAGPWDVLKLYGPNGRLLSLSAGLPPAPAASPYRLEVVAAHCHGMLLDEVGVDLRALEERVARLEAALRGDASELPAAVRLLQQQVERFRHKLQTAEHLSWMGFYSSAPPPLSTEACRRLQVRRQSDCNKKRVRERFFSICDAAVSEEVRLRLRQPSFDSYQWEDEELLLLLQQMFLDLQLLPRFGIELCVVRAFLFEVYKHYNDVPFHNFRHSFCVAQMMYSIIWATELPSKIGDLEILILLTSCICHDLDHPGYNNIYQINAKTELALRYNDISPLENHHCSVAFRVLENFDCNIFRTLPADVYRQVREGMIRCILATDMARHNEILAQFKEITPEFDFENKAHVNLLSMVLIKVADISNEARPLEVAEPWLDRLLQEFFAQSDAEKLQGLPVTPFMDRDKITKPSSQCSFIGLVLLPLFEALGDLFQVLVPLIVQPVRDALDYYRRLNERSHHRKSVADASGGSGGGDGGGGGALAKSGSAHSVKSRRSIASRSRSADVDDGGGGGGAADAFPEEVAAAASRTLPAPDEEDGEDDDAEDAFDGAFDGGDERDDDGDATATEVEVSEKTLKFKIATEPSIGGAGAGRRSGPCSRKGSRERTQHEFSQSDLMRAAQLVRDKQRTGSLATPAPTPTPPDACNGGGGGGRPDADESDADADAPTPTPPHSLLQRLKSLTDRLTLGGGGGGGGGGQAEDSDTAPSTPTPGQAPPPAKRAARARAGLRALLGGGAGGGGGGGGGGCAKRDAPSSSLELLSPSDVSPAATPTPPGHAKRQLFRHKRNSLGGGAGSLDSVLPPRKGGAGAGAGGGGGGGLLAQLTASFRVRRPRAAPAPGGGEAK